MQGGACSTQVPREYCTCLHGWFRCCGSVRVFTVRGRTIRGGGYPPLENSLTTEPCLSNEGDVERRRYATGDTLTAHASNTPPTMNNPAALPAESWMTPPVFTAAPGANVDEPLPPRGVEGTILASRRSNTKNRHHTVLIVGHIHVTIRRNCNARRLNPDCF